MGEKTYVIDDKIFAFHDGSNEGDLWTCLCTFPHNDGDDISKERIASLALLGAAMVLQTYRPEQMNINEDSGFGSLPESVPYWIRKEIYEKVLGEKYPIDKEDTYEK